MMVQPFDCVVVDSLVWPGGELPVRAHCDLCGDRWTVNDTTDLEEWMATHEHPQLALFGES